MSTRTLRPDTLAIHAGQPPDPSTGAVIGPIVTSSTFAYRGPTEPHEFGYARVDNPTRRQLERCMAALEGAGHGVAFGSGCAAMHAVLATLAPCDRVLCSDNVYGGTYRLLDTVVRPSGVEVRSVDPTDPDALEAALAGGARMLWLETPTNPLLHVVDVAEAARMAHAHGVQVVVDSTFATPALLRPLALGADVVVHSTTKYINGHSDVVGGIVLTRDDAWAERLRRLQKTVGAIPSPFDCYLVLRGLKTLSLRMGRHCKNAQAVAEALEGHPRVERVLYPGLRSHPHHALAARQMEGFGGMVTFVVAGGGAAAERVLSRLRLFTVAESLGGVESLASQPVRTSHAALPPDERARLGIVDGMIRLSVGIEAAEDLVADLTEALESP